ncbi:MAG: DsrE/DsrF/TusD sulfur relay family protein [Rhodospirillaceae bacterium]
MFAGQPRRPEESSGRTASDSFIAKIAGGRWREVQVTVFLMADAVLAAKAQQKTPEGYYNLERMLRRVLAGGGTVLLCGTCMDARGMGESEVMDGARRSTMDELAAATLEADKVLVF